MSTSSAVKTHYYGTASHRVPRSFPVRLVRRSRERRLLAYCGDRLAGELLRAEGAPPPTIIEADLRSWAKGLEVWGKEVAVLVGAEACRPLVTVWEDRFPDDHRIRSAIEAVDAWLAWPDDARAGACGQQANKARRAAAMARRQMGRVDGWAPAAFAAEALEFLCKSVSTGDRAEAVAAIIVRVLERVASAFDALGLPELELRAHLAQTLPAKVLQAYRQHAGHHRQPGLIRLARY